MALIVEDGTGKTNAESFAAVSDFTSYCTLYGLTVPAALADATKEIALRKATAFIVEQFETLFLGLRFSDAQALPFPRTGIILPGHLNPLDPAPLPTNLKNATIETAIVATTQDLYVPTTPEQVVTKERKTVGPITREFEYQLGFRYAPIDFVRSKIEALLAPLLASRSILSTRVVRA